MSYGSGNTNLLSTSNFKRLILGVMLTWIIIEGALRTPLARMLPDPDASYWYFGVVQLKLRQLNAIAPVDVLFISSSLMWDAIDPGQFSEQVQALTGKRLTAYNAGLPLLDAETTQIGLDTHILAANKKPPSYIVYGVSLVEMAQPGWHATAVHSVEGSSILLEDDPLSRRVQNWLYNNIYVIRYRNTIQLLFQPVDVSQYDTDPLGFHNLDKVFDVETFLNKNTDNSAAFKFDEGQFQRLENLIQDCQDRRVGIIIADLPNPSALFQAHHVSPELVAMYHRRLREIADSYHVPLYDPTVQQEAWVKNNRNYYDDTHLNSVGAEQMTKGFAEFFAGLTNPTVIAAPMTNSDTTF
jgi:hypothetical protein